MGAADGSGSHVAVVREGKQRGLDDVSYRADRGWVSNTWHQVVPSYLTNGTLLFLDGGLAASGPGLAFEPELATPLIDNVGGREGADSRTCWESSRVDSRGDACLRRFETVQRNGMEARAGGAVHWVARSCSGVE